MPANVYTFGTDTGAFVTEPEAQWLLKGPSDSSPWTAAYNSWILKEILADLEPLHDLYDSAGSGIQANKISPYGYPSKSSPVADDGILLSDWTTYAVWLKGTGGRAVKWTVSGGSGGHGWTFNGDGTVTIVDTKSVNGLRVGKDASSELRYGYDNAAYPTFRYDVSPRNGGWTANSPLETNVYVSPSGSADKAQIAGAGTGPFTSVARRPISLPHDTTRASNKVAFTLIGLQVDAFKLLSSATTSTIAIKYRDRSSGSVTTLASVTTTSTTAAPYSASVSVDLDTSSGEFFAEWSVANASLLDGAEVGYVYYILQKRAVE